MMPVDLALEDAADKLQSACNTATAAGNDDDDDDDDDCDGDVPAKRQRIQTTTVDYYNTTEHEAIIKVNIYIYIFISPINGSIYKKKRT